MDRKPLEVVAGKRGLPPSVLAAEFVGTALLVAIGLSVVILDFGRNSPVVRILPDAGLRRAITGFLFGGTGALIAMSPVGKHSGAHVNPVVTLAFLSMGTMRRGHALAYAVAQLLGAMAGAVPLLLWGALGRSVGYGSTVPGPGYGWSAALAGEVATTFALIVGLLFFVRHPRLRRWTPALFPVLYAAMVFLEAPVSGTSTNPARSLGPAVVSGTWRAAWVYWLGPVIGALAGVAVHRFTWLRRMEIAVAKLYHFEHDPHGIFRAIPSAERSDDAPHGSFGHR